VQEIEDRDDQMTEPTDASNQEPSQAHIGDWQAEHYGGAHYRTGSSRSYKHCSYCGSCHPAELAAEIRNGNVRLSFADFKYGWPHKVYIEGENPKGFIKFYSLHLKDASPEDKATIEASQNLHIEFEGGQVRWGPPQQTVESNNQTT
jgi:hypothetical protein